MAFNEEVYEKYGWEAAKQGIFPQWQNKTSSILEENPTLNRWDAGRLAYLELVGSEPDIL